jgi:chromosome segregation ATPase
VTDGIESRNLELRTSAREEERRRREEVLTSALQQQVDELRLVLREQANRQQRLEEQIRQSEAQVGQVRLELDTVRQEAGRLVQLRHLEEQRVRQQVANLQERVDEPLRPLRNVQAQVADLTEHIRLQREQIGQGARQVEAVAAIIETVRADAVRGVDAARQAREALETVQHAQSALGREIQKIGDQARLIEQEARRRAVAIEQQVENLATRLEAVAAIGPHLEELIRQTREEIRVFQPQIDAARDKDKQQDQQLSRVQTQAEERDTLMRGRVEDVREQLAREIAGVTAALNEALVGIHERIGEWEATHRDIVGRFGALGVEVRALQQADEQVAELVRRVEERLVRARLDQAQQAWEDLMERRQKESEE